MKGKPDTVVDIFCCCSVLENVCIFMTIYITMLYVTSLSGGGDIGWMIIEESTQHNKIVKVLQNILEIVVL